jgi:hypothetical protein
MLVNTENGWQRGDLKNDVQTGLEKRMVLGEVDVGIFFECPVSCFTFRAEIGGWGAIVYVACVHDLGW